MGTVKFMPFVSDFKELSWDEMSRVIGGVALSASGVKSFNISGSNIVINNATNVTINGNNNKIYIYK